MRTNLDNLNRSEQPNSQQETKVEFSHPTQQATKQEIKTEANHPHHQPNITHVPTTKKEEVDTVEQNYITQREIVAPYILNHLFNYNFPSIYAISPADNLVMSGLNYLPYSFNEIVQPQIHATNILHSLNPTFVESFSDTTRSVIPMNQPEKERMDEITQKFKNIMNSNQEIKEKINQISTYCLAKKTQPYEAIDAFISLGESKYKEIANFLIIDQPDTSIFKSLGNLFGQINRIDVEHVINHRKGTYNFKTWLNSLDRGTRRKTKDSQSPPRTIKTIDMLSKELLKLDSTTDKIQSIQDFIQQPPQEMYKRIQHFLDLDPVVYEDVLEAVWHQTPTISPVEMLATIMGVKIDTVEKEMAKKGLLNSERIDLNIGDTYEHLSQPILPSISSNTKDGIHPSQDISNSEEKHNKVRKKPKTAESIQGTPPKQETQIFKFFYTPRTQETNPQAQSNITISFTQSIGS